MSVSSRSSGSSSSSSSRSSTKSGNTSRKSSASGWTSSSSRSRDHPIPNDMLSNALIYLAGGRPSKVKKVRVYEDTYSRDLDPWGDHRSRVETKKEFQIVFIESSRGRSQRSSRRKSDDPWGKGKHGGGYDSDDETASQSTEGDEPEYGQAVPPQGAYPGMAPGMGPGMVPGMGHMGHPPPPPRDFPGRPGGMGPPPQQFGRPPMPPGNMPPFRGGPGGPPPPPPANFRPM